MYTKSKNVISTQDETNLIIIMREVYLQNSRNPSSNIELMRAEIKRLNELVYAKVVPKIISEILQYKKYLSDILKTYYKNDDHATEICNFILENRESTVKENIRLKTYKK